MHRVRKVFALGFAAFLLLGCAEKQSEPASPQVSRPGATTPADEPEVTQEPTAEPVVIPSCEEMVPLPEAQAVLDPQFILFSDAEMEQHHRSAMGAAAATAFAQETQSVFCGWGMPNSDGFSTLIVSEIPKHVRDEFIAELRASDFVESDINGAPVFEWPTGERVGPQFLWYGFTGELVVASWSLPSGGGVGAVALSNLH